MVAARVSSTQGQIDGDLYSNDFYAWTQAQSEAIGQGRWTDLDVPNLVEEIESLGRQQRSELRDRLSVLLAHLLKWEYQPAKRSRSWRNPIRIQRIDVADLMADNPSLKPYLSDAIARTHQKATIAAAEETGLDENAFPAEVSYTMQQVLDSSFPGIEA